MKLFAVCAAVPGYDPGTEAALKIVTDALAELGENAAVLQVSSLGALFYDGRPSPSLQPLFDSIAEADGVILACTAMGGAPCALMKMFMEHMEGAGRQLLRGKNCLLLTVGQSGGAHTAMESLAAFVYRMGGFDAVRVCAATEREMAEDEALRLMAERQAEDYYRVLRQHRRYVIPQAQPAAEAPEGKPKAKPKKKQEETPAAESANARERDGSLLDELSDGAYAALFGGALPEQPSAQSWIANAQPSVPEPAAEAPAPAPKKKGATNAVATLYAKHKQTVDTAEQAEDIGEITQFFAQKYLKTDEGIRPVSVEPVAAKLTPGVPSPKIKSCRQLTQSLPHSFNAQHAAGVQAVIQLQIMGSEAFDGYLTVQGTDCEYTDGQAEAHDIVIMAKEQAWTDVLRGKHTAQKAFMMGHITVRGNFMLLTKFDQMFQNVRG